MAQALSAMELDEEPSFSALLSEGIDSLDGFELIEELGRGGASVVYRAREPALNREVALKVLLGGPWLSQASRSRFLLEARAVASLDHPHIVSVHGFGEAVGHPYLVMKLIRGGTLSGAAARCRSEFPAERIARTMVEVARAVQHAHDRGILHRDLKPSNILLDDEGLAYVADFGLARWLAQDARATVSGTLMGTPAYASPEQASGTTEVTIATDVWGLGAVLYELLSGRPPFERASVVSLLRAIQEEEPIPPLALRNGGITSVHEHRGGLGYPEPDDGARRSVVAGTRSKTEHATPSRWMGKRPKPSRLESDLQVICLTCLRKEARRRYASAGAVADDLERCLDGLPIAARPISDFERVWHWSRRHPAWVVASVSVLLALVFVAWTGYATAARVARSRDEARMERALALRTVDRLETAAVMDRLEAHDSGGALALLARRLRANPENVGDAERVLSLLRLRRFAFPVESSIVRPVGHDSVSCVDGRHLLAYGRVTGVIECWDLGSRQRLWADTQSVAVTRIEGSTAAGCWAILDEVGHMELRPFETGACRVKIDVELSNPHSAKFSRDGAWLVVGGYTNVASLWEVGTGGRRALFVHGPLSLDRMEPKTRVLAFDFDPQSRRIASGGTDGVVQIWSVPDGQPLARFEHEAPVARVRFHPHRPLLASVGSSRVRLWDLERLTMLAELDLHGAHGGELVFGPGDESLMFGAEDGHLGRWDFQESSSLRNPIGFPQSLGALTSLSGGSRMAVTTELGGLWWLATGDRQEVVGELPSPRSRNGKDLPLWCRPDGREVVMQHRSGEIVRWRLPEGERCAWVLRHGAEVGSATFNCTGNQLATAAWNGEVGLWNLSDNSVSPGPKLRHGDRAWQVRFSPDGSRLATCGWDSKVQLWEPRTGQWIQSLVCERGGVWWMEFVDSGKCLLTAGSANHARRRPSAWAEAWSLEGVPKRLWSVGTNDFAWTPALSPDATRWVVPDRTDRSNLLPVVPRLLTVYDTASGDEAIRPLELPVRGSAMEEINSTAYSPDGNWIAAGGVDHAAVWNARTGELKWDLAHPLRIRSVCFHPDGRRFLTAGEDGTARIWDLETGALRSGTEILRHKAGTTTPIFDGTGIKSACFSPDGRWIATAAADRTARLWDAGTGLPISEPLAHDGPVLHVGFSPDGTWLVTGSADGSARLWRLARAQGAMPTWLPNFLEALSRHKLTDQDEAVALPLEAYFEVLRLARAEPPTGVWAEVLRPYLDYEEEAGR